MANLIKVTGSFIDAIRINEIGREWRDGRVFWVKRRRGWSNAVIYCANAFFAAVGNPVVVWSDPRDWQRWEIESYRLLHEAEGYCAFADGDTAVWAEQLPGTALERPALSGDLTEAMLAAAAMELKRAHGIPCQPLGGGWSHGDPHLGNFIYDDATSRARLIDFEVAHRTGLPEAQRHADDLLVILQNLMGYTDARGWLAAATCFLENYREGDSDSAGQAAIATLRRRLETPRGIDRIWWAIRTDYIPTQDRTGRIAALQTALERF